MNNPDTSCLDWEDRFLAGRTLVPDIEVDEKRADHALRIFKRLRLPDVFGTPTIEEAGAEWAYPLVRVIFGTYNTKTKRRAVQEYFLLVPKKNSKSTFAAAIMLVALIVNERLFAEAVLIGSYETCRRKRFRPSGENGQNRRRTF